MSEYQAVYDAVRSRISGCDTQSVVMEVLGRAFDTSYLSSRLNDAIGGVEWEYRRPSAVFRPQLSIDGNQWCALYGDNLQDGVAGFGDSPESAMAAFDAAWSAPIAKAEGGAA